MAEKPIIVGIAGGSGSGKTTLAERICRHMGSKAVNLGIDSFYKDLTPEEFENVLEFDFDHPDAIDWDDCCAAIEKLKNGQETPVPIYSYSEYKRTGTEIVQPAAIIIVEGMFAL